MGDGKGERELRLAAALRANLRRRKQAACQPADTDNSGDPDQTDPDAGGAEHPEAKG